MKIHQTSNQDTRAENSSEVLKVYSAAEMVSDSSPMPEDLIDQRILVSGGMLVLGGPAKVGKSDMLLNWLYHMAAGLEFLGMKTMRPLRVAHLQADVCGDPYIRERLKSIKIDDAYRSLAEKNMYLIPQARVLLNDQGVSVLSRTILECFKDESVDVISIDPLNSVFDGRDINDQNDMRFFLQRRLEVLRKNINPKAGIILVHQTRSYSEKEMAEDPFRAFRAIRDFYSSGISMYHPKANQSYRKLEFDIRNAKPADYGKAEIKSAFIDETVEVISMDAKAAALMGYKANSATAEEVKASV